MAKSNDLVRKGLYTDSRGKVVVHVFGSYKHSGYGESGENVVVEFENVRTGSVGDLEESKFNKKYPHHIDKITVEFSD